MKNAAYFKKINKKYAVHEWQAKCHYILLKNDEKCDQTELLVLISVFSNSRRNVLGGGGGHVYFVVVVGDFSRGWEDRSAWEGHR